MGPKQTYMGLRLSYMGLKLSYMGLKMSYMGLKLTYMWLKITHMGPKSINQALEFTFRTTASQTDPIDWPYTVNMAFRGGTNRFIPAIPFDKL